MAGVSAFDPDHALAIILQARFNEEAKKENVKKSKDKENLPVSLPRPETKSSLVDPEWETTDPCPDIHGLFVSFNERFFWGRLLGVEVKWSPQMTLCAGICVYEGRNGLCSVRLSAPLLKLRPRSDLVETLLHEMIHAYLFVTDNNRDRDGHGPEFHKHMNRINKEAGTNITVYHSFHAEVKLYQQHWWRCNGPCQSRPPFFGMVKRARNRAPGPNDLWWADHLAACGGQFIKVREPEDYKKKGSKVQKADKKQNGKDIREFFHNPSVKNKPAVSASVSSFNNKAGANIFGFNNLSTNAASTSLKGEKSQRKDHVNRVAGFGSTSPSANKPSRNKGNSRKNVGGGHLLGGGLNKKNSSPRHNIGRGNVLGNRGTGTLVVTGSQQKTKSNDKPQSPDTKLRVDRFKVFSGSGFTLGGGSDKDRSKSRLLKTCQDEPKDKKPRIEVSSPKSEDAKGFKKESDESMCNCSVCNKSVPREEVDMHLEICAGLKNVFNNSSTVVDFEEDNEINDVSNESEAVPCPVCNSDIQGDINSHLDECLNNSGILNLVDDSIAGATFEHTLLSNDNNFPICDVNCDSDLEIIEPEGRVACFVCGLRFGESKINDHVNQCLDSSN